MAAISKAKYSYLFSLYSTYVIYDNYNKYVFPVEIKMSYVKLQSK